MATLGKVIEDLVPDRLWERIAPLLPPLKIRRHRHRGRRPVDDRAALAGIVFVLKTGTAWNQLPTTLVGCSGVTCWRCLRDGTEAGVWPALHEQLLAHCTVLASWIWTRARSTARTCARSMGAHVGPSPVDRARPSCKHHLICDAGGLPLAVSITGANRNDVT